MDKTLRSILWVLVGLVVLSSFSTTYFFIAKERLYDDYLKLENLFKTNMDKFNSQVAGLNSEKDTLKSKLDAVSVQLKKLETDNSGLKSRYEDALNERDIVNRELASVRKGKAFLEKKLKQFESEMYVAGLLRDKVALQVELSRVKDSLVPKDMEIEKLKAVGLDKDAKISNLEAEKQLLADKHNDSIQVAEVLSQELLREKDKNLNDIQQSEKIRMENSALKSKLAEMGQMSGDYKTFAAETDDVNMRIAKLENELSGKNIEIEKLKIALKDNARNTQEFRAEAYHSKNEVELPPIVLNSRPYKEVKTAKLTTPALERINNEAFVEGRIVTVNREHNFVVIDLGKEDGIHLGNKFDVYKNDIHVGWIEVIQARDRIAAADIREVKEGYALEINDLIVKR